MSRTSGKDLGHTETFHALITKKFGHFLVWSKIRFVLWILKILLLNMIPKCLDTFLTSRLFFPNKLGKVVTKFQLDIRVFLSIYSSCYYFVLLRKFPQLGSP